MISIVVASGNPVKVQAALGGFQKMFPNQDFEILMARVPSGVRSQPFSSEETLQGAHNRASNAAHLHPQADFWVGIEGGVEENPDGLAAFAWIVVQSNDLVGKGRTGTFYLPPEVAQWVRQGKELGEADDIVFNRSNSKQENGAIGILTGDVIDRARLYEMAVILALVPFKNPELYREK
jgi:inosine/xanthosine triphosphatase